MFLKYKHSFIMSVIFTLVLIAAIYNPKNLELIRRGLSEFISVKLSGNLLYRPMSNFHRTNSSQKKNNQLLDGKPMVKDNLSLVMYSKDVITIVLYHPFHTMLRRYVRDFQQSRCIYKNCQIYSTFNISDKPLDVDAVLFQGNHMPAILPARRDKNQVFLFQTIESPMFVHFTNLNNKRFKRDYFNWTMTYRLDSDIPFPYGAVIPKSTNISDYKRLQELSDNLFTAIPESHAGNFNRDSLVEGHKNYKSIYQQKSIDAAWLVSHCKTASKRETYVKEMSKYMKIDIYGECSSLKCPKNTSSTCQKMVVRKYRFYLAFENSICSDYVTEKAFAWFNANIIIVVRGGRDYSRHFPKGTFIDTEDFPSPEALANYLLKLGSNESAYTEFLQRKDQFIAISENNRMQIAYCQLCRMLNNLDKYRKSVENIAQWWEKQGICIRPDI